MGGTSGTAGAAVGAVIAGTVASIRNGCISMLMRVAPPARNRMVISSSPGCSARTLRSSNISLSGGSAGIEIALTA